MVEAIRLVLGLLVDESVDGIKSAPLARHAINTDTISEAAHTANDEIHDTNTANISTNKSPGGRGPAERGNVLGTHEDVDVAVAQCQRLFFARAIDLSDWPTGRVGKAQLLKQVVRSHVTG